MNRVILTILLLVFGMPAFACSCVQLNEALKKKVKREFDQSDLILIGEVIDKRITSNGNSSSSSDLVIYDFKITNLIKGIAVGKIIQVLSYRGGDYCGFGFEIGGKYLVYSRQIDIREFENQKIESSLKDLESTYLTTLCDRTKGFYKTSEKEIKLLEKLGRIKK